MKTNKFFLTSVLMFCVLITAAQVTFTDATSLLGSFTGSGSSDCAVDMNGDYLDDVVRVTSSGIYIDFQQGDGSFVQEFFEMSIMNTPGWSICAADIDNNGFNDLCFGNGSRVSFCMSNNDGSAYTEIDYPEYIFSQRSTFCDIDNDGNIDAFVCHDVDQSHPYRNDGNGNMILDQTLIETLDVGGNYAAIWCDYDNDWDQDLYITKCRGGAPVGDPQRINLMYRNNGDGTFSEVGEEINMNDGDQSWTTLFEDFDNDGDFDAYTANHAWGNRFMENDGTGMFTDIIETTGIDAGDLGAWDCDAADFDNNGFVDIYYDSGNELWLNNGDGTFTNQSLPFGDGGIGDFNDDGFVDVMKDNTLWMNEGNDNNYVKVALEGIVSNLNGIGARIEIHGDWGIQIREIRSGESFSPMSSLVEHFGLGTATAIDQVIIKWPSGVITSIENPGINTTLIIPEAGCIAAPNEIEVVGETTICAGQSVELNAADGVSYSWSNGESTQSITVTEAGSYSVVIWGEDECASISNTVVIQVTEDPLPVVTIQGDEIACEGEAIILVATDGQNHNWSNGDTGQQIAVSESGDYFVMTDAFCSENQLESEPVTVTFFAAADMPTATNVELDVPGVATLTAVGDNMLWYDAETATDPVGSGDSFETEFVDQGSPLTYWVEANALYPAALQDGGKADDMGGGGLPSTGGVLFFDVYEAFTLLEVTIYVTDEAGAGERNIQLFDAANNMIAEHVETFEVGTHQVALNFEVPVGSGLSIGCEQNNLFRNSGGVNYPYSIGDLGSIYDSTFGGGYYYYFYNWQVQGEEMMCPSERVEVTASVVGIDLIDNVNAFAVYPNPAQDQVQITLDITNEAVVTLKLMDVTGKVVVNEAWGTVSGERQNTMDVSSLSSGVYMLEMNIDGQRLNQRLVIE